MFNVLLFFFSLSYSHISIREAEIPSQILICLHVWTQADNIQIVEEVRSSPKQTQSAQWFLSFSGGWTDGGLNHIGNNPVYNINILVDSNIISAYINLYSTWNGKYYHAIFIMNINILCFSILLKFWCTQWMVYVHFYLESRDFY